MLQLSRPCRRAAGKLIAGTLVTSSLLGLTAGPSFAQVNDQFATESVGATFNRGSRNTVVDVGVEQTDDRGHRSETLEVAITQSYCSNRTLVEVDLSGQIEGEDLPAVDVRARAGSATAIAHVPVEGTVSRTPTDNRLCENPDTGATVVEKVHTDARVGLLWINKFASRPVEFSGEDCGGDGQCYFRGADAFGAVFSINAGSAGLILVAGKSDSAFFFEGVYPIPAEGDLEDVA